jgi:hypothetical protein
VKGVRRTGEDGRRCGGKAESPVPRRGSKALKVVALPEDLDFEINDRFQRIIGG